jgi:signal transduction histidine kinase
MRNWATTIGLSVAIGLAYFLAAQLSLGLLLQPDGVAVFWPAAGISSGVLIALGPRARLAVVAGAMAATVAANLLGDRNVPAAFAFAVCNALEAVIAAGLLHRFFGDDFRLDRLNPVLGLLAAAIVGTTISGIGGAISYKLFHSPTGPMLITWRHWFTSDAVGIVAVAPLVIGCAAVFRDPPPRSEIVEGSAVLVVLALMTGIIISLPEQPWQTVVPGALLFPMLLWLAARCRPVFAAAGMFLVSLTVVWTTIFGIGHFGDTGLPIDDRIMQAQAVILVVTLGALILAALFAERRENEVRLARSNMLLERERDNKLMNLQAVGASIAHEMKQPLTAIAANGGAALSFLEKTPADLDEMRAILSDIVNDSHRASDALDGIRALFRKVSPGRQLVNVNEIASEVLQSLDTELKEHGVTVLPAFATELPAVLADRGQVQQVILNLVLNALEAMDTTTDRSRVLRVATVLRGRRDAIVVTVQDSGPGIAPQQLEGIFDALVSTKPHGMGLGLAISRMIVERYGGQLTVSSDGKSGAEFQFTIPWEQAVAAAERPGLETVSVTVPR